MVEQVLDASESGGWIGTSKVHSAWAESGERVFPVGATDGEDVMVVSHDRQILTLLHFECVQGGLANKIVFVK